MFCEEAILDFISIHKMRGVGVKDHQYITSDNSNIVKLVVSESKKLLFGVNM